MLITSTFFIIFVPKTNQCNAPMSAIHAYHFISKIKRFVNFKTRDIGANRDEKVIR